ncbi:MAG: hypothetical protein R2755_03335 [Acidimicrobiales bacterium]
MPELADVSVEIDGEQFVVRTTDRVAARSDQPFAEALAATMQARIDALAARVRVSAASPPADPARWGRGHAAELVAALSRAAGARPPHAAPGRRS